MALALLLASRCCRQASQVPVTTTQLQLLHLADTLCSRPFDPKRWSSNSKEQKESAAKQEVDKTPADAEKASANGKALHQSLRQGKAPHEPELRQWLSDTEELFRQSLGHITGSISLEHTVLRDEPTLWSTLQNYFVDFRGKAAVRVINEWIEKDFSEQEFLEGACDAYFMVNHLLSEEGFNDLSNMTSQRLLAAFKDTHDAYKRLGLRFTVVPGEDIEAKVVNMRLSGPEAINRYFATASSASRRADPDAEESESTSAQKDNNVDNPASTTASRQDGRDSAGSTGPDLGSQWLQIFVSFRAALECKVTNDKGELVQHVTDHRSHVWRFARPLPENLPRRLLSSSWQLLAID